MPSTNVSLNGGDKPQIFNRQPMSLNNTLTSQPRAPTPTMMNRPQIVYIRAPAPWGGINSYNGLQSQGPPTKLIRISNGSCIQQRPICITPITNGPLVPGLENETKSIPTNLNPTQQLEKTVQNVPNPPPTYGTNQIGPRLPYNPIRMVTCPNSLGLRPQQMIRPIYQTTLCPLSNIPSQPGCQQIRIIQRPSHGMINPMNVVRTQIIMPHQTSDYKNLQRSSSFQPLQGTIRPSSLQTQSQMCAWPQPVAPTSLPEATHTSQASQILSNSQIPSQNWQSIPMNAATNGTQLWHGNQCMQPQLPPMFQSENNITDLQLRNTTNLISQVPTLPGPLGNQNLMSTMKSISDEAMRSQEMKLQVMNITSSNSSEENTNMSSVALHNKLFNNSRHFSVEQSSLVAPSCVNPQPSITNTQLVDVEYEKLMASVGIT